MALTRVSGDLIGQNTVTNQNIAASVQDAYGWRNRIINGDMRISQRGPVTVNPDASGNVYTAADRWTTSDFFGTTGQIVTSIDADVPAGQGFTSSLLLSCTTTLSLDYGSSRVRQRIEGFNVSDLYSSDITVSFWVKSSVAGQYTAQITNSDFSRTYSVPVTINVVNTWEKKTFTVPLAEGASSGTWSTDNNTGLAFVFVLNASVYTGVEETWGSNSNALSGQAAWGTSGHTFRITGVQLEAGSVATAFERRDYGRELAMCQRYYYKIFPGAALKMLTPSGISTNSTNGNFFGQFPVTMRVAPTALEQSGTANQYSIAEPGIVSLTCTTVPAFGTTTTDSIFGISATVATGLTARSFAALRTDSTNGANAFLAWSAEL